ncbi:MAG: hypothetical protein SOT13_02255 [Candidatus Aphodousia sp.]|nr:hypothetical protein [Sutterella sp.]MDY2899334.1 hypothetical protein [Candidatus Aphodousia sp.]
MTVSRRFNNIKSSLTALAVTALAVTVTGCAAPTVSTQVSVSSRLSMTPDLHASLRPMPDWGDKMAVVPANASLAADSMWPTIKQQLEVMLQTANFETVARGQGEKYRVVADWAIEPSRKIQRSETVPVTIYAPVHLPPPPPPHFHGHRPPARHHFGVGFGVGVGYAPRVAYAERYYTVQLYRRVLRVSLQEMQGSNATTVFSTTVQHESSCKRIDDIMPYMIHNAINSLYVADGTSTTVTLPQTTAICR